MHMTPSYWEKEQWFETTSDECERRKFQSRTAFEHQEDKIHVYRRHT